MRQSSATMRLVLTAALLVPGALAIASSTGCSQGSAQAAASTDTTAVASNDSPGANKADMKKVILNVFGMT